MKIEQPTYNASAVDTDSFQLSDSDEYTNYDTDICDKQQDAEVFYMNRGNFQGQGNFQGRISQTRFNSN